MAKVTSRDVARLAGCSQTTVSLALNNRYDISISEEMRKRVFEAAKELNYTPNQFAKGLKTNKSNLIGLIVPNITNPFFSMLIYEMENYAYTKDYNIITCISYRQPEIEMAKHRLLTEKSVDGIIYTFTPSPESKDNITSLSKKTRLLIYGESDPDTSLDIVCYDGRNEGYLLAKHLLSLGHKKICYISQPFSPNYLSRIQRFKGIQDAMKEFGCEDDLITEAAEIPLSGNPIPTEFEVGYRFAEKVLKDRSVTAIIGMNDMIALGAMNYIQNHTSLSIPGDISICGFDDIYLGNLFHPSLTTVNHNLHQGCQIAIDTLLDIIKNGRTRQYRKYDYTSQLIVRNSSGPAKNHV